MEKNILNSFKDSFYFVKEKIGELSAISDLYIMQSCNHAIISNSSFIGGAPGYSLDIMSRSLWHLTILSIKIVRVLIGKLFMFKIKCV